MADLSDLSRGLNRVSIRLNKQIKLAVDKVAVELTTDLAIATPVDSGRALSNWQAGLIRQRDYIEAYFPGKYGSTRSENVQAVQSRARNNVRNRRLGKAIYVSNNAPYIKRLDEDGHSQQARNFIRPTVRQTVKKAQRFLRPLGAQIG